MQLDKRDSSLEILIAEHIVEWASDAGCGDVMNEQEYATCAN
jgi:hypothetical protein